jgi:hypothetical protein
MSQSGGPPKIVRFAPTWGRFLVLVQKIARDSGKVFFGGFAEDRLVAMDLSDFDILRSIGSGELVGEIEVVNPRLWTAHIRCNPRGHRKVIAVVSIVGSERIRVRNLWWDET